MKPSPGSPSAFTASTSAGLAWRFTQTKRLALESRAYSSSVSTFSALASERDAWRTSGSSEGSAQTESTSTLCASGVPRLS